MVMEKPKQNAQKLQHSKLDLIWLDQFKDILIYLHYNWKHFKPKAYSKIDHRTVFEHNWINFTWITSEFFRAFRSSHRWALTASLLSRNTLHVVQQHTDCRLKRPKVHWHGVMEDINTITLSSPAFFQTTVFSKWGPRWLLCTEATVLLECWWLFRHLKQNTLNAILPSVAVTTVYKKRKPF